MQLIEVPTETWAFLTCRSGLSGPEVSAALERSFEELTEVIARGGVRTQGQPRAHFRYRDAEGNRFEIGFPIHPDDERIAKEAGLNVGETDPGKALVHIHRGPYASLKDTYKQMEQDLQGRGMKGRGDLWELYLNDPDVCRSADLLTQIVWPVEAASIA